MSIVEWGVVLGFYLVLDGLAAASRLGKPLILSWFSPFSVSLGVSYTNLFQDAVLAIREPCPAYPSSMLNYQNMELVDIFWLDYFS